MAIAPPEVPPDHHEPSNVSVYFSIRHRLRIPPNNGLTREIRVARYLRGPQSRDIATGAMGGSMDG